MPALIIRRTEDGLGVTLPEEWLRETALGEGDQVGIEISKDGLILMTPDASHRRAMEFAREGMDRYREALAILAKS